MLEGIQRVNTDLDESQFSSLFIYLMSWPPRGTSSLRGQREDRGRWCRQLFYIQVRKMSMSFLSSFCCSWSKAFRPSSALRQRTHNRHVRPGFSLNPVLKSPWRSGLSSLDYLRRRELTEIWDGNKESIFLISYIWSHMGEKIIREEFWDEGSW